MKALSVRAPYIFDIMKGSKTIEYRTWQTPHRGDLLLVSSSNPRASYYNKKDGGWCEYNFKNRLPFGYAMCVINLTECRKVREEYHWLFDNVRPVIPFPVKGKLHLFDVDTKIQFVKTLDDAIRLWAKEELVISEEEYVDYLIEINSIEEMIL